MKAEFSHFEAARVDYIAADLIYQAAREMKAEWYRKTSMSDAEIHDAVQAGNMPQDWQDLDDASTAAIRQLSECRDALIDAAAEMTAILAPRLGIKDYQELPALWRYCKTHPYNEPTKKVIAALLKVSLP